MLVSLAALVLPALLIFGVYHLALWSDLGGVAAMPFWRRLAVASGLGHLLLAAAFFLFMYLDYRSVLQIAPSGPSFEVFLFNRAGFWRVMLVFDSLPSLLLLAVFAAMARWGWEWTHSVALTVAVVFVAGTFQWYWIGAGLGAASERLWSGLKTPDDDLPDWM
jgi:hypothetical protein